MSRLIKSPTKQFILYVVDDLVADFLYYGRKEDEDLGVEELQAAFRDGLITVEEVVTCFRTQLTKGLE